MSEAKTEKPENKAFELYEMRKEIMNIDYNLKLVEKNCNTININLKKGEIVQKEIETLNEATKVYDRCGRIFVLSNKQDILKKLTENKKTMIAELDSQNQKKKYLAGKLDEKSKEYVGAIQAIEKK